jgi:PAS domain S-box-containing protein
VFQNKDVPASGPQKPLSEREKQLIELAANGFTDSAIANRLGIAEATVATYWGRIRTKYGALSRPELIAHAVRGEYEAEIEGLRRQNHDLIRTLRQSTGRYQAGDPGGFFKDALESAADAVLIVDQHGNIDWVNAAAEELFGYGRDELKGKHQMMLIPERYRLIHRQHVKNYFALPSKRTMSEHSTTLLLTKTGDEIPIVATLSPLEAGDQAFAICVVRKVSSKD